MSRFLKLSLVVMALFHLIACKPSVTASESDSSRQATKKIVIYDMHKKQQRAVITDEKDVEDVLKQIEQRKKVLLKRLPVFKYEVQINQKGKDVIWLFSKEGIIQKKGIKGTDLQQIKNPEMIAKHIK